MAEATLTKEEQRTLTREKDIISFMHCRMCLQELPEGESPESYARLATGFTPEGFQVWCVRHDMNVLHMKLNDTIQNPMVA